MAHAGDIVENPVSGERCRWHLTAADTDGALVRAEFWVRAGGGTADHIHLRSDERFEVLSGRLVLAAPEEHVVLAGERARVAAGTPHRWRNGGDEELHMMVELDQPGDFEGALEDAFALAAEGRCDVNGFPKLLDAVVIALEHPCEAYFPNLPIGLQRVLFRVLGRLGRALGRGRPGTLRPVAA